MTSIQNSMTFSRNSREEMKAILLLVAASCLQASCTGQSPTHDYQELRVTLGDGSTCDNEITFHTITLINRTAWVLELEGLGGAPCIGVAALEPGAASVFFWPTHSGGETVSLQSGDSVQGVVMLDADSPYRLAIRVRTSQHGVWSVAKSSSSTNHDQEMQSTVFLDRGEFSLGPPTSDSGDRLQQ